MTRLGTAGAGWLVVAGLAIVTTVVFRTDPVQWVVTMAVGVAAAVLGLWLMARPSALAASASTVIAVAWGILYAVLAVLQADDVAALVTDVFLLAIGVVAGVMTYRAAATARLP